MRKHIFAKFSSKRPSYNDEITIEDSSDDETYVSDREILNHNLITDNPNDDDEENSNYDHNDSDQSVSYTCSTPPSSPDFQHIEEKLFEIQSKISLHLQKKRFIPESEVNGMLKTLKELQNLTPSQQSSLQSALEILQMISIKTSGESVPKLSGSKKIQKGSPKQKICTRKISNRKGSSASLFSKDCMEFNDKQKQNSDSDMNMISGTIDVNMDFLTNNNFGGSQSEAKSSVETDSFLRKFCEKEMENIAKQSQESSLFAVPRQYTSTDPFKKLHQISEISSFPSELLTHNNFDNTVTSGDTKFGNMTNRTTDSTENRLDKSVQRTDINTSKQKRKPDFLEFTKKESCELPRFCKYLEQEDLASEVHITSGTIDVNMDFLTNNNFGSSKSVVECSDESDLFLQMHREKGISEYVCETDNDSPNLETFTDYAQKKVDHFSSSITFLEFDKNQKNDLDFLGFADKEGDSKSTFDVNMDLSTNDNLEGAKYSIKSDSFIHKLYKKGSGSIDQKAQNPDAKTENERHLFAGPSQYISSYSNDPCNKSQHISEITTVSNTGDTDGVKYRGTTVISTKEHSIEIIDSTIPECDVDMSIIEQTKSVNHVNSGSQGMPCLDASQRTVDQSLCSTVVFPLELVTNTDFTNTVNSLGYSQAVDIFQDKILVDINQQNSTFSHVYLDNTIPETQCTVSEHQNDCYETTTNPGSIKIPTMQRKEKISALLKSMIDKNIPKNLAIDILSENFTEIDFNKEIDVPNEIGEAEDIEMETYGQQCLEMDPQSKPVIIGNVNVENIVIKKGKNKFESLSDKLPNKNASGSSLRKQSSGFMNIRDIENGDAPNNDLCIQHGQSDSFMNINDNASKNCDVSSVQFCNDQTKGEPSTSKSVGWLENGNSLDKTNHRTTNSDGSCDHKNSRSERIRKRKNKLRPIWDSLPDEKKVTAENIRKFGINMFEDPVENLLNLDVEYREPDPIFTCTKSTDCTFCNEISAKWSAYDYRQLMNDFQDACKEEIISAIEKADRSLSDTDSESDEDILRKKALKKEMKQKLDEMEIERQKFIAERKSEIEKNRAEMAKRRSELKKSTNRKISTTEMVKVMQDMDEFRKKRNLRSNSRNN